VRKEKKETQKQSRESALKILIQKRLEECASYFKHDLAEIDIEVAQRGLAGRSLSCVNVAFNACLKECEFMPRLADICRLMPEEPPTAGEVAVQRLEETLTRNGKVPERWTETLDGLTYHYFGDPKGYKVVERMTR
jgi:hypothetical protein